MLAKAAQLAADEIVLDLEDAVPAARKVDAREAAVGALADGALAQRRTAVRINAAGTPWAHADLIALGGAEHRPDSIVVPKVESAGDLAFVDRLLEGVERAVGHRRALRVQALVETPRGLGSLADIVWASQRLDAIILGYADLGALLGRGHAAKDAPLWLAVQDAVLCAARTAGIQAIDGPFLALADNDGLRASCARAARLGFDGKWAIHPAQLSVVTSAFTPDATEVRRARAMLAALERATADGQGATSLDGEMLDEAVRAAAERTLRRAASACE